MALTLAQKALYARLRQSGGMRFHGSEPANEALFEEMLDVFALEARNYDIVSESMARFRFLRARTSAEAAVDTRMLAADGTFAITAAGVAAGFSHVITDEARIELPSRPEHVFGFVVVGGIRTDYQPGGLFVPWGGATASDGTLHFVAPFASNRRVFPRITVGAQPHVLAVYGAGTAISSEAKVNATLTIRWGGAQTGFRLTLPDLLDMVSSAGVAGNAWTVRLVLAAGQAITAVGSAKRVRINYPAMETAGDVKSALETAGLTVVYLNGGADADAFMNPVAENDGFFTGGFDETFPFFDLYLAR